MTELQKLILKLNGLKEEQKKAFAAYEDVSKIPEAELKAIRDRNKEMQDLELEVARLTELEEMKTGAQSQFKHHTDDVKKDPAQVKTKVDYVRFGALKNFKGEQFGRKAEERAYRFAHWAMAVLAGNEKSRQFCKDNGIELKALSEGVNTAGGYLVPTEFSNDIIDLREQFGVFRRNVRVVPMMSDTKLVPRRTGGLTVYYPGEGVAITASDKAWDQVSLVARKYACLTLYSSEVNEDAMISIGDDLAGEIAYAFALAEDTNGFNGDGTSTYAGTKGVRQRLLDVYTVTGGVGLILGAGNAYSELTLANFHAVVGALPLYARGRAKWYCSALFHETVMGAIQTAAGGNQVMDIANGSQPRFLGFPVELSQVMPTTAANSQIPVFLGDLSMGAMLGDRRQLTLAYSTEYKFAEDQLAIKGTQRIDINIHDVGDATNPGPIVGLIMAAS